jgi:RHS repeat-associated protein
MRSQERALRYPHVRRSRRLGDPARAQAKPSTDGPRNIVQHRRGRRQLNATGTVTTEFVYANGVNVPDAILTGGKTYALLRDHLGSVRLVVDVQTGTIAQELAYDAFGQVTEDTNPDFQPFGFAGGLYDAETGLVHFGAREYDARIGRWISKDPIGFRGRQSSLDLARNVQCDGTPITNCIERAGGKRPGCMAHARRRFVEAAREGDSIALEGVRLLAPLFAVERAAARAGDTAEGRLTQPVPLAKREEQSALPGILQSVAILDILLATAYLCQPLADPLRRAPRRAASRSPSTFVPACSASILQLLEQRSFQRKSHAGNESRPRRSVIREAFRRGFCKPAGYVVRARVTLYAFFGRGHSSGHRAAVGRTGRQLVDC